MTQKKSLLLIFFQNSKYVFLKLMRLIFDFIIFRNILNTHMKLRELVNKMYLT